MSGSSPIPFGPERKDPSWRWGSFLIGVAGFVLLIWIATLGGIDLIGWWWWVVVILGALFSIRSGRAWTRGIPEDVVAHARAAQPTVDVRGQAGSTYVLLEAARPKQPRVRPREFGPFWWAVYSLAVRAPVQLGDYILTLAWRMSGGLWSSGTSSLQRQLQVEQADHPDEMRNTDRDRF